MKSKVKLSTFSSIISISIIVLMALLAVFSFQDKKTFYVLISLIFILIICSLFFAPMAIVANDKKIVVKAPLKKISIPLDEIKSVQNFRPVLLSYRVSGIRLFASGGFMGYWGVFYDPVIGKFTGYFGDSKSCFLLTKKNGDKYVLGCENPEEMVEYINNQLK